MEDNDDNSKKQKNRKFSKSNKNNFINFSLANNIENNPFEKNKNRRTKKKEIQLTTSQKSIINKESKINIEEMVKKVKKIMKYTDDEINGLSYDLALQYDKRNFCKYYISLIKTKHSFIFSFCYRKDYNSKILKIDIFFVDLVLNYATNGLFFDDDSMHKIYINKGSFNIKDEIEKIIYSTLISMVLDGILTLLALSNDNIISFKQQKTINNINKRKLQLKKVLNIKFILYFIISFIFLLFFWYYISMFGVIYRNTQYHLLKDTLISLLLSMLSPLAIYLFPGFFRIPSLSNPKNKRKCLYQISKILQYF